MNRFSIMTASAVALLVVCSSENASAQLTTISISPRSLGAEQIGAVDVAVLRCANIDVRSIVGLGTQLGTIGIGQLQGQGLRVIPSRQGVAGTTVTVQFDASQAKVANGDDEQRKNRTVAIVLARRGQSITAVVPFLIAEDQSIIAAVPKADEMPCYASPPSRCCPPRRILGCFRRASFEKTAEHGSYPNANEWGVAVLAAGTLLRDIDWRNWSNLAGTRVVRAKLLDVAGDKLLFYRADGSFATARLGDLSEADRALIVGWQTSEVLALAR